MLWGHRWTHFYFSVKYVVCLSYVACGAHICYMDVYIHGGQWVDTGHLNCSLPLVFLDPWSLRTWNSLIRLTGWPVSFSDPLVSTSLLGLQVHATSSSFYASAGDLNSHLHVFLGQALQKEIYLPASDELSSKVSICCCFQGICREVLCAGKVEFHIHSEAPFSHGHHTTASLPHLKAKATPAPTRRGTC